VRVEVWSIPIILVSEGSPSESGWIEGGSHSKVDEEKIWNLERRMGEQSHFGLGASLIRGEMVVRNERWMLGTIGHLIGSAQPAEPRLVACNCPSHKRRAPLMF